MSDEARGSVFDYDSRPVTVVDLRVAPPLCPIQVAPSDFSQSAQLIDRARESTTDWMHARHRHTGQAGLLELHRHVST